MLKANMKSIWSKFIIPVYIFALGVAHFNAIYSISCAFLLLGLLFFAWKERKSFLPKRLDPFFNIVYWPFFICVFLSSVLLGDYPSIQSAFNYFYWSMPFLILFFSLQYGRLNAEFIIGALSVSLLVLSISGIMEYVLADHMIRVKGVLGHPNCLATVLNLDLTFTMALAWEKRNYISKGVRIIACSAVFLGIITFMMTGSRGGMLGLILGGIFAYGICLEARCSMKKTLLTTKKLFVLAGSIFLIAVFFIVGMNVIQNRTIHQSYDMERVRLLDSSYHMWSDHKLLGVGIAQWGKEYQTKYIRADAKEPNLGVAHNVPAHFFSATGTVAGFSYLVYTIGLFVYMYKQKKRYPDNPYIGAFLWASLAIFIHGMVDLGILWNIALKLYSGLLGITMASLAGQKKDI